jgi:hypothetical protein
LGGVRGTKRKREEKKIHLIKVIENEMLILNMFLTLRVL